MGPFLGIVSFIWGKLPNYVRWPIAVMLSLPVAVLYFLSWHASSIQSAITPLSQRRDEQIKSILENQANQNRALLDGIKLLNQHQSIMYEAMLRDRK